MSDECYEGIGKEVMGRELGPSIKKCNCKSMGGGTPEKFSCVCEDYDGRKVEFPFLDEISFNANKNQEVVCSEVEKNKMACFPPLDGRREEIRR